MTGSDAARVVVCAGGLGTRTASWSRYIPKEFYPVGGRPGIVHLLEEIAQLAPAEVVIICHPYYRIFTAWARTALSQQAHDRYARKARLRPDGYPAAGLTVSFITQCGPYADITSVLNGADHLAVQGDMYVAFADNLYPQDDPLLALRRAPQGMPVVLARPYQPQLAASRGVIAAMPHLGQFLMRELTEKPDPAAAGELERRYGARNLLLLEGRARLTPDFIAFARAHEAPSGSEPKLALTLAAYARTRPVGVITTTSQVIDLGANPT